MFDYPELVEYLVPYLTPRDIARCAASCKAFAVMFKPYLYRHYSSTYGDRALAPFRRNAHHLRALEFRRSSIDDYLEVLAPAVALPDTMLPAVTSVTKSASPTMTNLRRFVLSGSHNLDDPLHIPSDTLQSIPGILDLNANITHLELRTKVDLLSSAIGTRLLNLIRGGLPRLQSLILVGSNVVPMVHAVELLKTCLGHPSLSHLQYFSDNQRYYGCQDQLVVGGLDLGSQTTPDSVIREQSNLLLEILSSPDKTNHHSADPIGYRLKTLALPYIKEGYPRAFLLPLLKSHLPNLERLEVPVLDGSYEGELEKVIADHCSNLQHVSCTLPSYAKTQSSSAIQAVIRGCAKWNRLKSVQITGYNEDNDTDASSGMLETLMKYHSKTLETIEFRGWKRRRGQVFRFDSIVTGCPNLKSFKVLPVNMWDRHNMSFADMTRVQWASQELKELRLHFAQKHRYLHDQEEAEAELEAGGKVFQEISKLTNLEALSLDFEIHSGYSPSEWSLGPDHEIKWLKDLAGLEKLRYLCLPLQYWTEEHMGELLDSSWPQLERISCRSLWLDPNLQKDSRWQWLKERRPSLQLGDFD